MDDLVRRGAEGTHHVEQQAPPAPPVKSASPPPWELVLHPLKTVRFVTALRTESRISWLRKLLYVGPLLVLLGAVLLPERMLAAAVALALPLVGPLANLPADAALDWAFLGLAAYALLGILPLGILPPTIVAEQHAQVFHPGRIARQGKRR